ncbi:MAG TPA: hypothetical protein VHO47_01930 [Candidatus Babeliales bacterium]|nr:hypothetical protein [Candidatus Babeliales bacterium]
MRTRTISLLFFFASTKTYSCEHDLFNTAKNTAISMAYIFAGYQTLKLSTYLRTKNYERIENAQFRQQNFRSALLPIICEEKYNGIGSLGFSLDVLTTLLGWGACYHLRAACIATKY